MTRSGRAILHFGTTIAFTAVTTIIAIMVSPRLERALGAEQFGAWRVLLEIAGYQALLEMGLSGAVGPTLARLLGQHDEDGIDHTIVTALRAYARVVLRTLVIGGTLAVVIPYLIRDLDAELQVDVRVAWLIGLMGSLVLLVSPLRGWTEARQLGYRVNMLLIVQAIVTAGASLLLALRGWGIRGQAIALVLGNFSFGFLLLAMCHKRGLRVIIHYARSSRDRQAEQKLMNLGKPILWTSIAGRVSILTDQVIVGAILGPIAVTHLFFTQRLAIMVQSVLQGIGSSTWAALAELYAKQEHQLFRQRVLDLTRWSAIVSCSGLGSIIAWNRSFVLLWTGDALLYGGDNVIVIAALNAMLLTLFSFWSWVLTATGHAREVVAPSLISAIVNVVASVALTTRLGLIGPLLGTSLAFLTVNSWWLPLRLARVFQIRATEITKLWIKPLILTGIMANIARALAALAEPRSWFDLFVCATLTWLMISGVLLGPSQSTKLVYSLGKRLNLAK